MTSSQRSVQSIASVEQELQELLGAVGVFVLEVDPALHVVHATPGLPALLGWPAGERLPPAAGPYPDFVRDAQSLLRGEAIPRRELRLGGHRYLSCGNVRMREGGRRHAVFRFLTATGVQRDDDLVRLAADSTDDYAIMTLDAAGRVTSWNTAAERVFGYAEADILGRHSEVLFTPEDRAADVPADEMRRAREHGRAEDERWHMRADGRRFFCSGVLTPLRNGHLHGYAKIARDLTLRRRAEREREVLLRHERIVRARAQAANQLKDEFLAVMSHELKHPLNLIYANAELLTRLPDVQASPLGQRAAQVIQRAVLSQAKIIDDLLDLSRLHTGKLRLVRTRVDWRRVVETVAEACAETAQAQGVALALAPGPSVWLDADEVRIEQIVWNLVSNAVKFTPEGGHVDVSLELCEELDAGPHAPARPGAWLQVRDTGRGIDPTALSRIFEMFTQADGYVTRREGGLGVGLALVRQLTELHGGRVRAQSAGAGQGAAFSVWLPLAAQLEQGADPQAGAPGAPAQPDHGSLAGVRVLLVDDSHETLEAFHQLLSLEGAQVSSATSGAAALALAEREEYDVVLSDIGMPEMDGHVLLARLRDMPRHGRVPAVALTGYGRAEDVRRARAAGFDAHLNKPVRLQALLEVLTNLSIRRQG